MPEKTEKALTMSAVIFDVLSCEFDGQRIENFFGCLRFNLSWLVVQSFRPRFPVPFFRTALKVGADMRVFTQIVVARFAVITFAGTAWLWSFIPSIQRKSFWLLQKLQNLLDHFFKKMRRMKPDPAHPSRVQSSDGLSLGYQPFSAPTLSGFFSLHLFSYTDRRVVANCCGKTVSSLQFSIFCFQILIGITT